VRCRSVLALALLLSPLPAAVRGQVPNATSGAGGGYRVRGCVPHATAGCGHEFGSVRILQLDRGARVYGGGFSFDDVPPGTYTLTYSQRCNPFGCRPPIGVRVVDRDVFVYFDLERTGWEPCLGDCDDDGSVGAGDLVECVSMALGRLYTCSACDADQNGRVAIHELSGAVANSRTGCPVSVD
jgi:hypothetical protein